MWWVRAGTLSGQHLRKVGLSRHGRYPTDGCIAGRSGARKCRTSYRENCLRCSHLGVEPRSNRYASSYTPFGPCPCRYCYSRGRKSRARSQSHSLDLCSFGRSARRSRALHHANIGLHPTGRRTSSASSLGGYSGSGYYVYPAL